MFRLLLAGLHYNENADRQQAINNSGEAMFTIRFPKYKKGDYTVTPIKESSTFGRIFILIFFGLSNQPH